MGSDKLYIKELKRKFVKKTSLTIDDFYQFYKEINKEIKLNTVRWYVYKLKDQKIIKNISRGIYVFENSIGTEELEYAVITIDIIDSSKQVNKEFNKILLEKIERLNKEIKEKLNYKRKYFISQGDEIQIFCLYDDRLIRLLLLTLSCLSPYKCRFAISIGNFLQNSLAENSWEMNGPIFWNGRDKLNNMKKNKKYSGAIVSEYSSIDNICNKMLKVILKLVNKISQKQWDAIFYQMIENDVNKIIKELGISQTSYYDRINNSNLSEIIEGLEAIILIIDKRRLLA